jgi:hypothetical protein
MSKVPCQEHPADWHNSFAVTNPGQNGYRDPAVSAARREAAKRAATGCKPCPMLRQCARDATRSRPASGVWATVDIGGKWNTAVHDTLEMIAAGGDPR